MAKKKETFDVTPIINAMNDIEYDLIFRLRMSINNNICMEEDGSLIQIDDKPICYPKETFNDFNIVKFDPFFNRKLAYFLFQRYVYIYLSEHPDVSIESFSMAYELFNPTAMFAVCRTNKGIIESSRFKNETLCWIDLLYKMDKADIPYEDLANIDNGITWIRKEEV
jgi:hypothetical protein